MDNISGGYPSMIWIVNLMVCKYYKWVGITIVIDNPTKIVGTITQGVLENKMEIAEE